MKKQIKDKIIKEKDVCKEMKRIGVMPEGIDLMRDKSIFRLIRLSNIKAPMANIIKEGMLSAGGEAAVHKLCCACKVEYSDILLMGTITQYSHLLKNLSKQPYKGKLIAKRIKKIIFS